MKGVKGKFQVGDYIVGQGFGVWNNLWERFRL